MSGRFVRASKYRHVYGTASKREYCYDNLKVTRNAVDGNLAKVNPLFLSVCWEAGGGGAFAVIPLSKTGKLTPEFPLYTGHTAAVLDTDFNPFNDHVIASCGEDGKIMIWNIPQEGLTKHATTPSGTLSGHEKKIHNVLFHPTAQSVLASASTDLTVRLWDAEQGQQRGPVLPHPDMIHALCWNYNGSLLFTSCKDKKVRAWDVRSGQVAHEYTAHMGVKGTYLALADRDDRFITTGFSKLSDRQVSLWDLRSSEPLRTENLDTSSGSLIPYCDVDTSLLFLAGKGDGNIRYYEMVREDPFLHPISEYKSSEPQRGIAVMPKRGVDVHQNEIVRIYKVTPTMIEPISFTVPRKSDMFQADLYPNTAGAQPALQAEEFFAGKTANPILISLEGGFKPSSTVQEFSMSRSGNTTPEPSLSSNGQAMAKNMTVEQLYQENEDLKRQVASLKAELDALKR